MITMVIFSVTVLALIYVHIFGLRYDGVIGSQLGASDQSRMAFGHLLDDIRRAGLYKIGTLSGTNFTGDVAGAPQQGNTIRLWVYTNTTAFVQYSLDTASCELRRTETGVSGYDVTAQYLTNTASFGCNSNIFVAEDGAGNVNTTLNLKWVVHVTLQFYQYKYPKTTVGPGYYYDFYKLEFRASPRATSWGTLNL